jgi:filamentous hemagglutinin family protein
MELQMTHQVTLAARNPRFVRPTRNALLMSCASAALAAAALMPQPAGAQAFVGTPTTTAGSVNYNRSTPGAETITVGTNTATIAWTPTGQSQNGTINFLPTGNTATFTSTQGVTDYTVLNRILPQTGEPISLNGHVISTLQGTSATGGRVWFYSPGGIVIGSTAVFDVGSLLLTTNDLTGIEGNVAGFSGAAGSTSRIQVQNGAQINALQPGSYVAMIAPRVEQGGKVRVNGSAAYVAAEQATMTVNQGLFDIQVDVGTTDANGVVHTGETSGPASTGAADPHRIYMVAVPKNQALTMLLGGKVGFDDAVGASIENGQIVLSSGYSVSGDSFDNAYLGGAIAGTPANITIAGGNFSSSVTGAATGTIHASGGGGTLTFARDVSLQGLQSASLTANDGETITVGGNATISANDFREFNTTNSEMGLDASAGLASIAAATGGTINISGSATVRADARGGNNTALLTGGTSSGGYAEINADGGTISIGGTTLVAARGLIALTPLSGINGYDGTGGYADVNADFGGTLTVNGTLTVDGGANGSANTLTSGGTGGFGQGGVGAITASDGGAIHVNGTANVYAVGFGGQSPTSPDGSAGEGDGGHAYVAASTGGSLTFGGDLIVDGSGVGGNALGQGGAGYGGSADMFVNGGAVTVGDAFGIYAEGIGGTGITGGNGYGGSASIEFTGGEGTGAGGSLTAANFSTVEASGSGGNGMDNASGTGGQGGDGYGGSAWFYVSDFQDAESTISINLGDMQVYANANGGNGGNGLVGGDGGGAYSFNYFGEGSYFNGDATIELYAGTVNTGTLYSYSTSRGGHGGNGSAGAGGNGGDAYGGSSTITVGTNLTAATASSYDRAFAGNGGSGTSQGDGGYAQGGYALVEVLDGGHLTGNVDIATTAFGGAGNVGGASLGGYSLLETEGTLTAGTITIDAGAFGGNGMTGGDGTGGSALFANFGGIVTASGATNVSAIAFGGDGWTNAAGTGGMGGNGTGGEASISSLGSGIFALTEGPTLALGAVSINAKGEGGTGGNGANGGAGGSGEAGYSAISLDGGDSMTAARTEVFARGIGGDGGVGSNGAGGAGGTGSGRSASLLVGSGASLTGTTYEGSTNGIGGIGGAGTAGRGDGGTGISGDDYASISGSVTYGGTTDEHNGFIVTSYAMGGAGGTGGSAFSGSSSIDVSGSLSVAGQTQSTAQAGGGNGDTVGGSGYAGSAYVNVSGNLTTANLHVADVATGGNGSTMGGDAYGGSASFSADGGTAHIGNAATIMASATGGNASEGLGGFAGGGFASFASYDGGTITGGDVTMNADATAGIGLSTSGASGGFVSVDALGFNPESPNTIAVGNMTLSAIATTNGPSIEGAGFGEIEMSAIGGSISADTLVANASGTDFGGTISLDAGDFGDLPASLQFGTVNATANGNTFGGNIVVSTAGGSTIDLGTAALNVSSGFGGLIYLAAGGCGECGSGDDLAAQAATLPAGGGIAATDLTMNTTGNIILGLSDGADIAVSGTLKGTAGQTISLIDDGTGGAIRAHVIDLSAITILDQADLIADIIRLTSSSDMMLGALSASDAMTLIAGGDLTTGDLSAGNALALTGRNVDTGNLSAPTVKVTADQESSVRNVDATGSASFTAGGLASFNGVVRSPSITVTSGDIDIAEGASLGVFGVTNDVTLNAIGHGQPVIIGDGPAAEGQYHLDEDGDINSSSVTINSDADVKVYDVQIEGSATSGAGISHVALNSQGSVFVNGLVDFTNAGASDGLAIKAGNRIEINTDTGGIQITDSTGHLAGTLGLTAQDIWVASGSMLALLETNPNFPGRDAALGINSGTANQDGFLRAGTIEALIGDTLLVQNSGTGDLFGGVDTGAGGLSIETFGETPATVVAYGRQTTGNGTVITNQDFLNSVDLSGTGGFTDDSAVNGCAIGGTCTEEEPFTIDMASILGPLDQTNSPDDEKKKDKDEGEDSDDGSSVDPSLRLINTTPINLDKTVDDPVTSGGDVVIGGPSN